MILSLKQKLDDQVERGKSERQEVQNLKGGKGAVIIYKDKIKHPDPRTHDAGAILLEKRSTIGYHVHEDDFEIITILAGLVRINGDVYCPGNSFTCEKGMGHDVENLAEDVSILRYVKKK